MQFWEYLKDCVVPHHPTKTEITWGRLFPTHHILLHPEGNRQPVKPNYHLAKWFLRGRRLNSHRVTGDQHAPRASYSPNVTEHR